MSHQFDAQSLTDLEGLCRIKCTPEEEKELLHSLSRILEHVRALDEVDTKDVPPCTYVLKSMLKTVLREDEIEETLPRETFLSNAPDQIGGMVRIPPVLRAAP